VAAGAHPYPDARIWAPWNLIMDARSCLGPRSICYSAGIVHLCENAVVSQGAHLCAATHNHRDPAFTLMIAPIVIEADAWVAAEAFVGPGVTVGSRAVVAARSVAMKDVPSGKVVAGNPAAIVAER
jgi:putative colanic acid biosynthesis acetyltransferase WcaF